MKNLLATAAILAFAMPAMALDPSKLAQLEPGKTITFRDPRPLVVGCTDHADANRMKQFNKQDNDFAKQEFVDWLDSLRLS